MIGLLLTLVTLVGGIGLVALALQTAAARRVRVPVRSFPRRSDEISEADTR